MNSPLGLHSSTWVADRCLRLAWDEGGDAHESVRAAVQAIAQASLPALVDVTPAYASVLLTCDLRKLKPLDFEDDVLAALVTAAAASPRTAMSDVPRDLEIPVCYCARCGPDLAEVARLHELEPEEVVRLHAAPEYRVAFLGFSPGFPYLLGLDERLATPRLERPRARVAPGSVAIAGTQAGIYPQATPGGWRLLGRTTLTLFDAARTPPALLAPGDRVRFRPDAHHDELVPGPR